MTTIPNLNEWVNSGEVRSAKSKRPFCWQEKAALRLIRDSFDETGDVKEALAVYLVLTEIASDERSETFTRRKGEIASKSGVSYRKTADTLKRLENLSLIRVVANKLAGTSANAPNTYTLLSVSLGTGCRRLGIDPKNVPCRDSKNNAFNNLSQQNENKTRTLVQEAEVFEALGYDQDTSQKLTLYDRTCVRADVGFLPVDEFNETLAKRLGGFEDLEELERLFTWTVELVRRREWSRKSKTLRGILEDSEINEPPPNESDIPF